MPAPLTTGVALLSFASLLRNAAARLRTWYSRSPIVAAVAVTSSAIPTLHSIPLPTATTLVDRVKAGRDAVARDQTKSQPKRRRPIQPRPTLWNCEVQRHAEQAVLWTSRGGGPHWSQCRRGDPGNSTTSEQSPASSGHAPPRIAACVSPFGHDMQLVADLSRNSPTLATWERERTDWEFEQAWLLVVTGHWVAVRGRWFVDTWSNGTPVRIADAPRRRKRVRYAYRVYTARS